MLDWTEIILRLCIATLAGGAIGLNRDLHGKPIGLKTLSLVSLATAMLLTMVHSDDVRIVSDAGSRVVQGILTGIGFLGAGVIVHAGRHFRVRGLTSAGLPGLRACIGIVCGLGQWRLVTVALVITFAVLPVSAAHLNVGCTRSSAAKEETLHEPLLIIGRPCRPSRT